MAFSAFCLLPKSSSPGALALEQKVASKLFVHSSAPISTGFLPMCVRGHRKLVIVMAIFWPSCALPVTGKLDPKILVLGPFSSENIGPPDQICLEKVVLA